jgi:hypothetical protein
VTAAGSGRFWALLILLIALWMHRLAMDLFVGICIARFRGWEVRFELALGWLFGPLGTLVFAARYGVAVIAGKWRSRRRASLARD